LTAALAVKMNPDREAELKRLAAADLHIADAERAVAEQIAKVNALNLTAQDTAIAERQLMAFQETLAVLQDYRASIVKTIERIGTGSP
jgi:uncharacterized protein YPO0396